MKKKGIVLLITLFFITAISVLLLKNLDDSEKFIKEVSVNNALTQIKLTAKNTQEEILKLTSTYQENIDDILEITSAGIPFSYGDIDLVISLEEYDYKICNINDLNTTTHIYEKCADMMQYLNYPNDFIQELKPYIKKVTTQEQIDFIIERYKTKTRDEKADNLKEYLSFLTLPNEESSTRYMQCKVNITTNENQANYFFVFKLGESKNILSEKLVLY